MNKLLTMISAVALLTAIAGPVYADQHEKTVFITRTIFDGNLGGLTGADDKCQAEANDPASIVPSGTYLAWLSDGTDSPDTRFTKSSYPYILSDGTMIAENFADLTDGSILHTINMMPTGKPLGLQGFWTGTNADGTTLQHLVTCNSWAGDTWPGSHGMAGNTIQKSTLWSARIPVPCRQSRRLACFQQ